KNPRKIPHTARGEGAGKKKNHYLFPPPGCLFYAVAKKTFFSFFFPPRNDQINFFTIPPTTPNTRFGKNKKTRFFFLKVGFHKKHVRPSGVRLWGRESFSMGKRMAQTPKITT
ncbi:hypothetical protein DNR41_27215, partial [Escherichia coli]|uniref:hypothetical protein n=1 Tax=Escherichia coli TaxID=562 RepID=UPI000DBC00F5